jgi:hypothetical protein
MNSLDDLPQSEVDALIRRAYVEFFHWQTSPDGAGLSAKLRGHISLLNQLAQHRPQDARRIRGLSGRMEKFRVDIADQGHDV